MSTFIQTSPTLDAYWRAIILFGRNSASYKFALGKTLLELASEEKTFIKLEELAEPFSRHITEHLASVDRQGTSQSSQFLDACRDFNQAKIDHDQLIETTIRLGFANVIDAFHNVNNAELPQRFFMDERSGRGGIAITDEMLRLKDHLQFANLPGEVEARWRLVETAWSLEISPRLLVVEYDHAGDELYLIPSGSRRIDVTSARDALNGYQKGKCFYCFADIRIDELTGSPAEVDHFFPHMLSQLPEFAAVNIDGVWNLVLSCVNCNRGVGGKSARVPEIRYLKRLHRRNNYLIDSHHPLRETLMTQTGRDEPRRRAFLQRMHRLAVNTLIHLWRPINESPAVF
jgi:hypothetical protein